MQANLLASKLFKLVANCSEQTANQNTNIVAEVSKVARERTSSLTVTTTARIEMYQSQQAVMLLIMRYSKLTSSPDEDQQ